MKVDIGRRTMLLGVPATLLALAKTASGQGVAAPPLKLIIECGGQKYLFDQRSGKELGDYVDPLDRFVQRCIVVRRPEIPFTVFFRPDRDGTRQEVVVELGRLWSGPAKAWPAYSAVILAGDDRLATIAVPEHYWHSRWRWQSKPRAVTVTADKLIADGLLPPYDTALRRAGAGAPSFAAALPPTQTITASPRRDANGNLVAVQNGKAEGGSAAAGNPGAYSVMGLAGMMKYMPSTGERDEIGLLTEAQAEYVVTGSGAALTHTLAQAEASGTMPWHMRDETTNAPLNFDQHPRAGWYYKKEESSPWIDPGEADVTVDDAHQPALGYLPFLLTGDPYYLEAIQFAATHNFGAFPAVYREGATGILPYVQIRSYAWSLRTLAQAARMTPEKAPPWLLPRSYWAEKFENNRAWFERVYVHGTAPLQAVFRAFVLDYEVPSLKMWQEEFLACVLAWVCRMGFDRWRAVYDWSIASTIARTNGKSGWVRAQSTPYDFYYKADATAPVARSWSEAWAVHSKLAKPEVRDVNTLVDLDLTYATYTRGALAFATYFDTPEADACYRWIDTELRRKNFKIAAKWQLAPRS